MEDGDYLSEVRDQYELLPYPHRDPAEERTRLLQTNLDYLPRINHYCFRGRRDFRRNFNVLVAGGGTGDAVIYLAEQLRTTNARIVYLDISSASMALAQERAKVRGLSNIEWIHGSLLDLDRLGLGGFDYINCSGVLHHLEDPQLGLRSLASGLADDGALGIMVYAKYGRTAVYQMQELMRLINDGETQIQRKIDNTWRTLQSLPPTNWLKRSEELHTDHQRYGDTGLYDLFLHSHDRAYSVPELFDWLKQGGLQFIDFAGDRTPYEPRCYLADERVLASVQAAPRETQYAIAELMSGAITKHAFYCARHSDTVASVSGSMIPVLSDSLPRDELMERMNPANYGSTYVFQQSGARVSVTIDPFVCAFFSQVDRQRTIDEIGDALTLQLKPHPNERAGLQHNVRALCEMLIGLDKLYLCRKDAMR